jgi:Caspase domain
MANNWAIAIGINQYQFLQPLACAQADALALLTFLIEDGAFKQQQCLLMSDTSPPIGDRPTTPTKENILLLLEDLAAACWHPSDRVWFFFSGYGVNHNGRDYLMPIDGNPERIEETAIEAAALMQSLQVSGVNLLIVLDINRAFGTLNEIYVGQEIIDLAQELQLPLILSCQPEQFSYESSELGHSFFAAALLEALRSGNGNTLGELEAYLSIRTPELCQHFWRPTQNPVTVITSSKQVILGNFELENDDAPAIVVSEEIFANSLSAPVLDNATNKNNSTNLPQSAPNYYSQLHKTQNLQNSHNTKNQLATTSFGEYGQGYINPSEMSVIPDNNLRSLPASLPPARPRVETQQLASTIPAPDEPEQQPEQQSSTGVPFWLQVALWGGSMTLLLGMIVLLLFRNQSGVVEQNNQPSSSVVPDEASLVRPAPENSITPPPHVSEAPVAPTTAQPAISSSPTTTPKVRPTLSAIPESTSKPQVTVAVASTPQTRKQALAELDKLSLIPTQANDLKIAIATARKLKSDDPQYSQAQANIQVWNSMIFDLAQERAKKRQYSSAIAAAQLIGENEALYPKADSAVTQWRKEAKQYVSNKTVVEAATALIKPGQASSYNRAIEVAKKVSKGEPGFDIAQKSIDKWSKEILNLARKRAASGDRRAAVSTATLVPHGTPVYGAAQRAIQQWKK